MENFPKIAYRPEMLKPDISVRKISDMKPVLYHPEKITDDYYHYTVFRNCDIIGGKLRYDVTLIPPNVVSGEFAKTFGHYHKDLFPELYEVLEGSCYFLLQRHSGNPIFIQEVYIAEASIGEKAIMPPGYGHLSINAGKDPLVLANWIGLVPYDYETFKALRGGCYYAVGKNGGVEFIKNPEYKAVPEIKKLKLRDLPELGIINNTSSPIWDLRSAPEKLEWLVNPEKFADKLTIEKLYREI